MIIDYFVISLTLSRNSFVISNEDFTPAYISLMLNSEVLVPTDNPNDLYAVNLTYQPKSCVDCRERGGSNIKPSYWPN